MQKYILKKKVLEKMDKCPKEERKKKKREKGKIAHDLYAHA
jgi:hypothetical protein